MVTFKAEVYAHQKRADGTYNIKIRVTHKQRKKYLATPWYVGKEDLTRSLKLKNQRYIDMVEDVIRRYRSICNDTGEGLEDMDVGQIVEMITRKSREQHFRLDIVAYTRKYIDKLFDMGRIGTARAARAMINNLVKFVGRESVDVNEITVKFLNDWIEWISEQPPRYGEKRGRAESLYVFGLRAMYNRAKREFNDEDAGLIRIPYSPFSHVDVPKPLIPKKRAITIEQIRAIAALPYEPKRFHSKANSFNLAKDMFILSFLLIGMNAVDLFNLTDYKDGRITYQRAKTKNRRADKAEISILVPPEAKALFEKYKDPSGERVFCLYKMFTTKVGLNRSLNIGLKYIGEKLGIERLQFYAARHSWATIAANDADIDKYTVHVALNHVDPQMSITDVYIRKSWDNIDKANRKVLDLVNFKFNTDTEAFIK